MGSGWQFQLRNRLGPTVCALPGSRQPQAGEAMASIAGYPSRQCTGSGAEARRFATKSRFPRWVGVSRVSQTSKRVVMNWVKDNAANCSRLAAADTIARLGGSERGAWFRRAATGYAWRLGSAAQSFASADWSAGAGVLEGCSTCCSWPGRQTASRIEMRRAYSLMPVTTGNGTAGTAPGPTGFACVRRVAHCHPASCSQPTSPPSAIDVRRSYLQFGGDAPND